MERFPFRKLLVYQKALDLSAEANRIASLIPVDHRDLRWQLRRAARSIVLNIAEGAGEYSPAEKARIYRIARRSGWETIGALDIAIRESQVQEEETDHVMQMLHEVTAMITMSKRAEQRVPRRRPRRRPEAQ